jgi:hypothetical protein
MRSSPKARTASRRWAAAGSPGDKHYQNVCLIDSLRSLGVKLQYTADGPFWALSDGNAMISSFGKVLRPADKKDLSKIGKYIIYGNGHFMGVEVFQEGTFLYPSCRRHITMEVCVERSDPTHRGMPTLRMDAIEAVFELFHVSASCSDEATVHDALGGVPDGAIDLHDDQTTPAGPTSEQLARISANRAEAMRRRNLRPTRRSLTASAHHRRAARPDRHTPFRCAPLASRNALA